MGPHDGNHEGVLASATANALYELMFQIRPIQPRGDRV